MSDEPIRKRTPEEIKAYTDGYNACFERFCECLKGRKSVMDAVKKMRVFVDVVNGVTRREGERMRLIDADAVFPWYIEEFNKKAAPDRKIEPNEVRFSMYDIQGNLDNIPTIEQPTDGDTISRQAAIDAILAKPAWHGSDGSYYHTDDIRDAVNQLPPAQPERKTGHWIYTDRTNIYGGREIVCSECGESFMISPQTQEHLYECERFCCRCGAKMEPVKHCGADYCEI